MLVAGPLADHVFEPALMSGGVFTNTFGGLVGIGPGAGMGLMFVAAGSLTALIGLSGYTFKAIRDVEDILPDHDIAVASLETKSEVV